jgi:hypothetical protein
MYAHTATLRKGVNKTNYFNNTIACFKAIRQLPDNLTFLYKSDFSEYWTDDTYLYRISNHWGFVNNCQWFLNKPLYGNVIGMCKFENMRFLNSKFKIN